MPDRVPSEEQQRARIRAAALKIEAELVQRINAGEPNLCEQVEEVQLTLQRVGREPSYSETLIMAEQSKRRALRNEERQA